MSRFIEEAIMFGIQHMDRKDDIYIIDPEGEYDPEIKEYNKE